MMWLVGEQVSIKTGTGYRLWTEWHDGECREAYFEWRAESAGWKVLAVDMARHHLQAMLNFGFTYERRAYPLVPAMRTPPINDISPVSWDFVWECFKHEECPYGLLFSVDSIVKDLAEIARCLA